MSANKGYKKKISRFSVNTGAFDECLLVSVFLFISMHFLICEINREQSVSEAP